MCVLFRKRENNCGGRGVWLCVWSIPLWPPSVPCCLISISCQVQETPSSAFISHRQAWYWRHLYWECWGQVPITINHGTFRPHHFLKDRQILSPPLWRLHDHTSHHPRWQLPSLRLQPHPQSPPVWPNTCRNLITLFSSLCPGGGSTQKVWVRVSVCGGKESSKHHGSTLSH